MCKDCFTDEVKEFPERNYWEKIDLILSQKLAEGKIIYKEFVNDALRDKDDGKYFYKCTSCGETWKLREPNGNFGGGYFLKESTKESASVKFSV